MIQDPTIHHPLATGRPPGWARAWGQDRRGVFASFEVKGVKHRLRWVPSGSFWMGSPPGEAGRGANEGPQREVAFEEGFWLGETPCTQDLWQVVMKDNPSRFESKDRPVDTVTWEKCQEFCSKVNDLVPGLEARLPWEREWEYACRAGTGTATWKGDLEILGRGNAPLLDDIAWYGGNSGVDFDLAEGRDSSGWPEKQYDHDKAGTRPVRLKEPNPWGFHDMLGNVYEWCLDEAGQGTAARVVRGGSWPSLARRVRAAFRDWAPPGARNPYLGFRLCRGPEAEPR